MNALTRLGIPLEGSATAEEALKQGLLRDWHVRKVPLYAALPPDIYGVSRTIEVTERVSAVRDNPLVADQVDHLGIVSPSYRVIQNEEQEPLLDALAEESGATFAYAGEMDGGSKAFVSLRLPGQLTVGHDRLEVYLTTVKSHDGTKPFTVLASPLHPATGTLLDSFEVLRVSHSSRAPEMIQEELRSVLDRAFDYLEDFRATADQLAATPMGYAKFEALSDTRVNAVVDDRIGNLDTASPSQAKRADRRLTEITALFDEDQSSAWAGFLALARWNDHCSPTRGDDRDTARAVKALLDPRFKNRALQLMKEV